MRGNNFDISFFEEISPQLGYVLGWIASDGYLSQNRITICLKSTDYAILQSINTMISNKLPLRYFSQFDKRTQKTYHRVSLSFCTTNIDQFVKEYKLTERKSLTLEWPSLPEVMLVPYMRGFFDG